LTLKGPYKLHPSRKTILTDPVRLNSEGKFIFNHHPVACDSSAAQAADPDLLVQLK